MSLLLTIVLDENQPGLKQLKMPAYPTTRFNFTGDVNYVETVVKPLGIPLQYGLSWYDDEKGLVTRHTDAYGDPLTSVLAWQLVGHLKNAANRPFQLAAIAYLEALPPNTEVILYWQ